MYRKILHVLVLFIMIIGVGGCSMQPEAIEYPTWYNQPPKDGSKLYGVAKADSKEEAVAKAKNMILANILLSISHRDVRYVDMTSVKKIAPFVYLDESKIEELEELDNGEVVVEVSLDHNALITREKEALTKLYKKLQEAYAKRNEQHHTLSKFAYLSSFELEVNELDYYLSILDVIDPAFKANTYQDFIDNFRFTMIDLRMALSVKILSDADALEYIRVIQESFAQNEIVTLIASPDAKENVILKMSTTSQQFESQQFKMVKVKLTFDFLDTDGKKIRSHSVILKGKSTRSYQDAKIDSARYLEHLIATRGLFEVLGF